MKRAESLKKLISIKTDSADSQILLDNLVDEIIFIENLYLETCFHILKVQSFQ